MYDLRSGKRKSRNLGLLFLTVLLLTLAAVMFGITSCAGRYEYSMDRATEPIGRGEFGESADIRKYCDEQKNDLLCKEALARGRVKEKNSGWGLLVPGPTVSPYPAYGYPYSYGYPSHSLGYAPLHSTEPHPPYMYYNRRDMIEYLERDKQKAESLKNDEEKMKEESP